MELPPAIPMFNEIIENHIHHTGEINYFAAGVFAALSEDNVIGHNSIHDVPHHAIKLGSSGLSRNIIEYNDIRRTCQRTDDTGAINCWADAQAAQRPAARPHHPLQPASSSSAATASTWTTTPAIASSTET